MNQLTHSLLAGLNALTDETQDLMIAKANVTTQQPNEAHHRSAAVLAKSRQAYDRVRDRAVTGAKAADAAMHEHPYRGMGIALGLGAIIGIFVALRCLRNTE